MAAKDLRIELRSRIVLNQVVPFALVVLVMFGFALDDDAVLSRVAPGLIWLATMFSLLIVVQRAFLQIVAVALAVLLYQPASGSTGERLRLDLPGLALLAVTLLAATCGL